MVINYTSLEKGIVQKTYALRQQFMGPLLNALSKAGMTANKITYFRGLLMAVMVYQLFVRASFMGASITYIVFLILDGLDGALARFQNASSDKGKFNDIFIDLLTYSFFMFGLAFLSIGSVSLLFYHVIIHGAVYLLATLVKNINNQSDWLIHAEPNLMYLKAIASVAFIFLLLFKINMVDIFVFFLNIWMTILAVFYFIVLQRIQFNRFK